MAGRAVISRLASQTDGCPQDGAEGDPVERQRRRKASNEWRRKPLTKWIAEQARERAERRRDPRRSGFLVWSSWW